QGDHEERGCVGRSGHGNRGNRRDFRGSRPSPCYGVASSFSTSACSLPLVEIPDFPCIVNSPVIEVNRPPASLTIIGKGPASHDAITGSTMISARPVATRQWP